MTPGVQPAMRLFDAHCHLQDERIGVSLKAVLARAADAGVARFACCAGEQSEWPRVAELATVHPGIIPSFGIHPWYIKGRGATWRADLVAMLERWPAAGVGEIGLDHAIPDRSDADQLEVFVAQCEVARDLRRPISIHCRKAWGTLVDALATVPDLPPFVIHSYSGTAELIPPLAEHGASFSFSGSLTFSGNRKGRASAAAAPKDRLLIETDAPDLLPNLGGTHPMGSSPVPNEPANLVHVARALAEIRGTTVADIAATTWNNACRLFGAQGE